MNATLLYSIGAFVFAATDEPVGDPAQEYLADGITAELISGLSHVIGLKVISRTSVMQYKGEKKKTLSQIGRELNVDAVLEGSVLRSGNRVRIEAHMVYAPTEQTLMTETFDRDLEDVLKLQGDVAAAVTKQIGLRLTVEQYMLLNPARRVNSEAMEDFLKAIQLDWGHSATEQAGSGLPRPVPGLCGEVV